MSERTTVLAIDPGPIESAYVFWDGERIGERGKVKNKDLLGKINVVYIFGKPTEFCIEMIASYGMAVGAEVFETCVWIGRFMEATNGLAHRLKRKEIAMHLCDSPRANDSNIRAALIDRLGAPGTKKAPGPTYGVSGDVWAALAVAVTWWDKNGKAETK